MSHIGILEDSEVLRVEIAGFFSQRGHTVYQAGTLAEFWPLMENIALAILDINLPDGEGFDAAKRMRAQKATEPDYPSDITAIAGRQAQWTQRRRRYLPRQAVQAARAGSLCKLATNKNRARLASVQPAPRLVEPPRGNSCCSNRPNIKFANCLQTMLTPSLSKEPWWNR
jgi:CheY-like chemotaxis protein